MFGEYGYMEEGKLGKPYNFRLLKRLAHYAIPYKRTISTALCLTIFITIFDLAVPYLSKIAIDQYILSGWYKVEISRLKNGEARKFLSHYSNLLEKGKDGSPCCISSREFRKMASDDLRTYKLMGLFSGKPLHKITPDMLAKLPISGESRESFYEMADGSFLIPGSALRYVSREDILKLRAEDLRGVMLVAAVFLFMLVLSFGLSYAEYYLLEFTGQHMMQDIRIKLFQKLQSQAVRFFDRHPVGRLVTRVTNDIENLNEMFKSVVTTVFKDFFLLIGILAILFYLNWRLALVSFALLPFIFGLTLLFSSLAREAFRELRATVAKINAFLQERITGMRVIQLFVREQFQMDRFIQINHENFLAGMKQIRVFAVFMPIMELFASFAVALIIWYGGGNVIQQQLTLGSLVAFISYIQLFFKPIRDISEKYNIMQSAMASTERIFEFMDHEEIIPESKRPSKPTDVKGHLIFKDISFAYEKNKPVLHNISFEIRPGETIAIVGATGSGKTTLVNLAERFYDPDKGKVLLDGLDLKRWPKKELRRNIGLCMQDVFIFAGNLKENISLGSDKIDDKAIKRAVLDANAVGFIEKLPGGFHQEISEGGSTLSAGERQLLSFARAMAANPKILILDEATSSIDPETEALIQDAISRMVSKRTTLVVAHRLSTVRNADRILVMQKGEIVEQGTHDELIRLGGVYYRLDRLREINEANRSHSE